MRKNLFALSFLLLAWGCASFKKLTMVTEEFPRAADCGHCHVAVYEEWRTSPHATAYTDREYRQATGGHRFNACVPCHAPEPRYTEARPVARDYHLDEGVTCVSCHLEQNSIAGPVDPTGIVAPHPVEVMEERYRESHLCGRCHEGTLAEWEAAPGKDRKSCQDCHMPRVQRTLTQPTDFMSKVIVSFEEEVFQKSHTFEPYPELPGEPWLSASLVPEATGVTVVLENLLPHSFPTGDFGIRIVRLEAEALDPEGRSVFRDSRELTPKLETAIPARGVLRWRLPVRTGFERLMVGAVRPDAGDRGRTELFQKEIPRP